MSNIEYGYPPRSALATGTVDAPEGGLAPIASNRLDVWTSDRLAAALASPTGGTYVNGVYNNPNSEKNSLQNLYREVVSVTRFQNKYDGTISQRTAQVQACFDYAGANGFGVFIPSSFFLDARNNPQTWGDIETTRGLRIYSDGAIISLRGTLKRWNIVLSQYNDELSIDGRLTLRTNGNSGVGMQVSYTVPGFENRDGERVYIRGMEFQGDNPQTNGWDTALKLIDINGGLYENLRFRGRTSGTGNPLESLNTISPVGMEITGTVPGGDHRILSSRAHAFANVIKVGGVMEGVTIDKFFALNVGRLVQWTGSAAPVMLQVSKCHVNSYYGVIQAENVQQGVYTDGDYYRNPFTQTSNWVGIDLVNPIDTVIDNNCYAVYGTMANTACAIKVRGSQTNALNIGDGERYGATYGQLDWAIDANDITIPARTIRFPTPGFPVFNNNFRVAPVLYPTTFQIIGNVREAEFALTADQDFTTGVETTMAFTSILSDSIGMVSYGGELQFPPGLAGRKVEIILNTVWKQLRNDGITAVNQRSVKLYRNGTLKAEDTRDYSTLGTTPLNLSTSFTVLGNELTKPTGFQNSGNTLKLLAANTRLIFRITG